MTVTVADSGEEIYNDTLNDTHVQVPGATLRACHDYIVTVVVNDGSGKQSTHTSMDSITASFLLSHITIPT